MIPISGTSVKRLSNTLWNRDPKNTEHDPIASIAVDGLSLCSTNSTEKPSFFNLLSSSTDSGRSDSTVPPLTTTILMLEMLFWCATLRITVNNLFR